MERVRRTYKGKTKNHPIFTKKEADEQEIQYMYWKEARYIGDWVITDDDWVCEVLGVNGPYSSETSNKVGMQIVLPFARPWLRQSAEINYEEFKKSHNPWEATPRRWDQAEAGKSRTKRVIRLYTKILLKKGRVPEEEMVKLAKLYRPDEKIPVATLKKLLKQKAIKKMVAQELEKMLTEADITPEKVIKDYKEVFEKAQENKQHGVAKKVLDTFSEMLGMTKSAKVGGELPPGGTGDGDLSGFLLESERTEVVPEDEEFLNEEDQVDYVDVG